MCVLSFLPISTFSTPIYTYSSSVRADSSSCCLWRYARGTQTTRQDTNDTSQKKRAMYSYVPVLQIKCNVLQIKMQWQTCWIRKAEHTPTSQPASQSDKFEEQNLQLQVISPPRACVFSSGYAAPERRAPSERGQTSCVKKKKQIKKLSIVTPHFEYSYFLLRVLKEYAPL